MAAENSTEATVGMPQLDFSTFSNQTFWLVLVLLCLFLMIRVLVIPRMDNILTNRRKVIEEDLIGAETLRDSAAQLRESINNEVDSARSRAAEILKKNKDKIKSDYEAGMSEASEITEKLLEDSEKRIVKMEKSADQEIEKICGKLVPEIIEKIAPELNKS